VRRTAFGKETLKGIGSVVVETEQVALEEALHAGFGPRETCAYLEKRLFEAGIGVATKEGQSGPWNHPVLYLRLSVLKISQRAYCYGINLYLMQQAVLPDGALTKALTWERGIIGTVVDDKWDALQVNLDKTVDWFVSDYLELNPPADKADDSKSPGEAVH
jgi:hypothetical protein